MKQGILGASAATYNLMVLTVVFEGTNLALVQTIYNRH